MKVTIEQPSESKDFGDLATICIRAYSPGECFKLGNMAKELRDGGNPAVSGEAPNGKEGMFIRIPLVPDASSTNEKSGLQIGDRIRVLSGSTYCDPIHYGRVGEVIEIEPGGEYDAIGVRLRPVGSMAGGGDNSQSKNYVFDRQALVLFDWRDNEL
ncbi:hypothetical protein OAE43_00960 [Akkermansiaceae bacterium]|nr:hypothetical protein [Akkermansiaceae bacterium]